MPLDPRESEALIRLSEQIAALSKKMDALSDLALTVREHSVLLDGFRKSDSGQHAAITQLRTEADKNEGGRRIIFWVVSIWGFVMVSAAVVMIMSHEKGAVTSQQLYDLQQQVNAQGGHR